MNFENFLNEFVPTLEKKSKAVNLATWILETTGMPDAATLKSELETDYRLYFNDKSTYDKLKKWETDGSIQDPLLKRQLNILLRAFKPHMIEKELIREISKQETHIALLFSNFRPKLAGKSVSDNEIREILKSENDVELRKKAWEASKEVGCELAAPILNLVKLRNKAAKSLGYRNFFSMQLELQEIDETELFLTLNAVAKDSENAYEKALNDINKTASARFNVSLDALGPWTWADPFCQEDPLDAKELDLLAVGGDLLDRARKFFAASGFDVEEILNQSDNFERPGKNQHAFCISIDREKDVRTLNNLKPTTKWQETLLHELGHAVYELGFDTKLPWLLREPPHMLTTEAMALLCGRQAYRKEALSFLAPHTSMALREKAEASLKRRQLIFSRWVLVMTYFEQQLYENPDQDLNRLWWTLVKKFQKISSQGSKSGADWASKYHIGLAPVYYYSYLLGELLASALEEKIAPFASEQTGHFLQTRLFKPGNSLNWNQLIQEALGEPLNSKAWLKQFA